jgi:hypothetical protein
MDEIDGIWSCNGLKFDTYKIFDTFWLININGDQNIGQKKIPLMIRSFLSLVVNLKNFGPRSIGCFKQSNYYVTKNLILANEINNQSEGVRHNFDIRRLKVVVTTAH